MLSLDWPQQVGSVLTPTPRKNVCKNRLHSIPTLPHNIRRTPFKTVHMEASDIPRNPDRCRNFDDDNDTQYALHEVPGILGNIPCSKCYQKRSNL